MTARCERCGGEKRLPCDACCWKDRCDEPSHVSRHDIKNGTRKCRKCDGSFFVPCPVCPPPPAERVEVPETPAQVRERLRYAVEPEHADVIIHSWLSQLRRERDDATRDLAAMPYVGGEALASRREEAQSQRSPSLGGIPQYGPPQPTIEGAMAAAPADVGEGRVTSHPIKHEATPQGDGASPPVNQHGPGSFPQTCGHIARRPECYSCANRAAEARDAEIAALTKERDELRAINNCNRWRAEEAERKFGEALSQWNAAKAQLSALKPTAEGIERAAKVAEDYIPAAFVRPVVVLKILEAHGPWSAFQRTTVLTGSKRDATTDPRDAEIAGLRERLDERTAALKSMHINRDHRGKGRP